MSVKCGDTIGHPIFSSCVIFTFDLLGPKKSTKDQGASRSLCVPHFVIGYNIFYRATAERDIVRCVGVDKGQRSRWHGHATQTCAAVRLHFQLLPSSCRIRYAELLLVTNRAIKLHAAAALWQVSRPPSLSPLASPGP